MGLRRVLGEPSTSSWYVAHLTFLAQTLLTEKLVSFNKRSLVSLIFQLRGHCLTSHHSFPSLLDFHEGGRTWYVDHIRKT